MSKQDAKRCKVCGSVLRTGDLVVETIKGSFIFGETPSRSFSILEGYHGSCFDNLFPVKRVVRQPFRCEKCLGEFRLGEIVIYKYRGKKPKSPYRRSENRGHSIISIFHENCGK